MKKFVSYSVSLFFLCLILIGCQEQAAHVDEQFGEGMIIPKDSSVAFFKGFTFYPDQTKPDTSKLKTRLSLYLYHPSQGKASIIKEFGTIKNWPADWKTHLDQGQDLIAFSIQNKQHKRPGKDEGIYLYHLESQNLKKIEDTGNNFWISPDAKLIIYHKLDKDSEQYNLYGYDTDSGKRNLLDEGQPRIKDVEWLRDGEAALLMTEEKDSTILINLK
jgi:hypothetical protein